ncbi:unannotated protein [freshwater metagenome]|uniref:Unannotated protein n=1 Tax=freshwater metagenome TaxID=449393 RepID=A0A6J6UXF1_9ZZZZ
MGSLAAEPGKCFCASEAAAELHWRVDGTDRTSGGDWCDRTSRGDWCDRSDGRVRRYWCDGRVRRWEHGSDWCYWVR